MSQGGVSTYETCLADWEAILPALASLLGAAYAPGDFDRAADAFAASGEEGRRWQLEGPGGRLAIRLERYEGYLFGRFEAPPPACEAGRRLLEAALLAQGGRPEEGDPPPGDAR